MKWHVAMVLFAGLALAADPPKDDPAMQDMEKLKATWSVIAGEARGEKAPDEVIKIMKVDVDGNKFTVRFGDTVAEKGTFKLDPSKKPKVIDWIVDGDEKKLAKGIYELDGDNWKLCVKTKAGLPAPAVFATQKDSDSQMIIMKRDKP